MSILEITLLWPCGLLLVIDEIYELRVSSAPYENTQSSRIEDDPLVVAHPPTLDWFSLAAKGEVTRPLNYTAFGIDHLNWGLVKEELEIRC